MNELAALFEGWNTPVVRACLQGTMGRVDVWSGRSALASIGDFCFLGGKPVPERQNTLTAAGYSPLRPLCPKDFS